MKRNFSDMNEEDARKYYLEMLDAFEKFKSGDRSVFDYGFKFNWNDVSKVHSNSVLEYDREFNVKNDIENEMNDLLEKLSFLLLLKKDKNKFFNSNTFMKYASKYAYLYNITTTFDNNNTPYDYFFKLNDDYYTLDISDSFDDFGYNDDYFRHYGDSLYCCELVKYHNLIEYDDRKISMTFAYDRESNRIVDIMGINRYSLPKNNSVNVKTIDDDDVLKRILK